LGHDRLRVGFLYPGYAAEDDIPYLADRLEPPVAAQVVHTSVGEDAHRVDALLDLGSMVRLQAGADELAARDVMAVLWACTSGSFVFGWDGAHQQAADLERHVGVPASSASLAFVAACEALGLERVAVAATYPADVTAHLVSFLDRAGVEVLAASSQGIVTAAEVGTLGEQAVRDLVVDHDHPGAQAVLVPDTALHTARWLPELEGLVGKPVLTANQVSVWHAIHLAGHPGVGRNVGRLLDPEASHR
jgi:maleate cis-trans isomerase